MTAGQPSGSEPYASDDPELDHQRLAMVEHWIGMNRADRALEELQSLNGPVATSAAAYLLRARAELLRGAVGARNAARALRASIAAHGPGPDELYLLAKALNWSGDNQGAEAAVLQALAADSYDATLLATYAEICLDIGNLKRAAALLDRAAVTEPQSPAVIRMRALLAHARGDDRGAALFAREYLAIDPEDPAANALTTFLAASRGDAPRAYDSARRWASVDTGNEDAVVAARTLRADSHWLMWPLRPVQRYGRLPVWLAGVAALVVAQSSGVEWFAGVVTVVWLTFIVYSWVVPPLVQRLAGPRSADRR